MLREFKFAQNVVLSETQVARAALHSAYKSEASGQAYKEEVNNYINAHLKGLENAYSEGLAKNMDSARCFEAAESTKSELREKTLKDTKEQLAFEWMDAQKWKTQMETSIATNGELKVQKVLR